jgi:hypothetical protein
MKYYLFFFALLASIFGGAQGAWAESPSGHAFCPDAPVPSILSARAADAYKADPTGLKIKIAGCNATMASYLVALQIVDPKAGLTDVSQLSGYFAKLVCKPADRTYDWQTSVLYFLKNGGQDVALGGDTREADVGEQVCSNLATGADVYMGRCGNPGAVKVDRVAVEARCLKIISPTMGAGAIKRTAYIGPAPLPGICHSLQRAGVAHLETDYPEDCPMGNTQKTLDDGRVVTQVCNWDADVREVHRLLQVPVKVQNLSTSYRTTVANGVDELIVPVTVKDGAVTICWTLPNGQVIAMFVRAADYRNGVATITPEIVRSMVWHP